LVNPTLVMSIHPAFPRYSQTFPNIPKHSPKFLLIPLLFFELIRNRLNFDKVIPVSQGFCYE